MAAVIGQLRARIVRHRFQSEVIGASLLAFVAFIAVGIRANRAAEPVRLETARLSMASSEVARFRAAFSAGNSEREPRATQLADSLGLAIARDNRVTLAQQVAARAESLGLVGVRVKFAPADSAPPPRRPELSHGAVNIADYTLVLDCEGGLAPVLSLLNQLPPSIALQRMTAVKPRGISQFRLTFVVFESAAAPGKGPEHG